VTVVELDRAYNVRDLGGLTVSDGGLTRSGVIYRGDSLDSISKRDEEILFRKLDIGMVIDLRTRAEVQAADWMQGPVVYHRFPLIDDNRLGKEPFPSDNAQELAKVYLNNAKDGRTVIKDVFTDLHSCLSDGVPCIFHCAAGRDRTGVIAALLLDLVGVRESDIASDYVRSNHNAKQVTRRLARNVLYSNSSTPPSEVILLKPETIEHFLELIRQEAGSTAQFLRQTCEVEPRILSGIQHGLVLDQ
jgi:protein-tyrosine phosphatase